SFSAWPTGLGQVASNGWKTWCRGSSPACPGRSKAWAGCCRWCACWRSPSSSTACCRRLLKNPLSTSSQTASGGPEGYNRAATKGVPMTPPDDYLRHLIAALWFALCWVGYTRYATWKGRDTPCLASVMHLYREDWMRRMLQRDNRIAEASVSANLGRNASFFASSTLIILAGVLTALGASERAVSLLAELPFIEPVGRGMSEIKLLSLALIFVYAFFTFSWCMRQYNFAAVLLGSAPLIAERNVSEDRKNIFA